MKLQTDKGFGDLTFKANKGKIKLGRTGTFELSKHDQILKTDKMIFNLK